MFSIYHPECNVLYCIAPQDACIIGTQRRSALKPKYAHPSFLFLHVLSDAPLPQTPDPCGARSKPEIIDLGQGRA